VAVGAGDQTAASVGAGLFRPGRRSIPPAPPTSLRRQKPHSTEETTDSIRPSPERHSEYSRLRAAYGLLAESIAPVFEAMGRRR
jgi:hypothetical protein